MRSYAFKVPPLKGKRTLGPEANLERFTPGSHEVTAVGRLEGQVSLLQVARSYLKRMQGNLGELEELLTASLYNPEAMPMSVVERLIKERLTQVKALSEAASFAGHALLNGKSGVWGETTGNGLSFVRGGAQVQSSQGQGFPVAVNRLAKPASLLGREPLSQEAIAQESLLVVAEGKQEVKFKVERQTNVQSLIEGLQMSLYKGGIDVSVYQARDGRLVLLHNRQGSRHRFLGMSLKTRLLSHQPGAMIPSQEGQDIQGSIGLEPAEGSGSFLIGSQGNPRTSGLVLHYDGKLEYPGQIVGYASITQKGGLVPLDAQCKRQERLSLPAVGPEVLSLGLGGPSGYPCLANLKGSSQQEKMDSLRLLNQALNELKILEDELRQKETQYVDLAIQLLQEGLQPKDAGDDIIAFSKDRAEEMAQQLKAMLSLESHGGSNRMA